MRMAGRMGSDRVTVKNLKIVKIDKDKNQFLISGAVPGSRGTLFGDKGLKIMETNVYNQKGEKDVGDKIIRYCF